MTMMKLLRLLTVNSRPIPTEDSTDLQRLQYDYAKLYQAYQDRGKELEGLAKIIGKFQGAFGKIDKAIMEVLTD